MDTWRLISLCPEFASHTTTNNPVPATTIAAAREQFSQTLFADLLGFSGGAIAMLGFRVVMYAGGLVSVLVYLANLSQVRSLRAVDVPDVPGG